MRTIAYDVIGVNVFLPTLMRILPKNKDNSVRPILLACSLRKVLFVVNHSRYSTALKRIWKYLACGSS